MVPTPLNSNPMIEHISPFLAKSTDHGSVNKLSVAGVHNGDELALRLVWPSEKNDKIVDLDQFVDGVAVMFPLTANASAVTMGAKGYPVNAWYWKGDIKDISYDVVAEGYGTSIRVKDIDRKKVFVGAIHKQGNWHVVLSRSLENGNNQARFLPGSPAKMAFAVWDGGNRERAGRKSFSGDFIEAMLDK